MKTKNSKPVNSKVNPLLDKLLPTKRTPAYYHCLANKTTKQLTGNITKSCHDCKEQSSNLAIQRTKQINKIATAYKQLGLNLAKLLIA